VENVQDGELLRIFVGEDDEHDGRPLYEAIVQLLRREGLAGATVFRGIMGFGASSLIHTAKVLRLSEDLPIVIECVDRAEQVEAVLPLLDEMITEGLVTVEKAEVRIYRGREGA
jgi:PII-like signaling protein